MSQTTEIDIEKLPDKLKADRQIIECIQHDFAVILRLKRNNRIADRIHQPEDE